MADTAFVGRRHEMRHALNALKDSLAGRTTVLLLGGEPGSGKSRMADEVAVQAKDQGVQAVWGRCWEAGGAPAYWPWVQSLRSVIRDLTADGLRARLGSGSVDLAPLLPEIRESLNDIPAPPKLEPEIARFRLFDSVTTFLRRTATTRPLMVVLDDLQVADTPSLLLLRFLAATLTDARILVLGTYRDTEVLPDHPFASALAELSRQQGVRRITLGGLTQADVADFVRASAGVLPPETLTRAVYEETEGNPLFVREVVHLLIDEGRLGAGLSEPQSLLRMPSTVREVIARRLKPLSPESLHVLSLASILGREFSLEALRLLAGRPLDEVLDSLDEPRSAGVVTEVPTVTGRLRFSHVLIRESLHSDIGRAQRIQLHRRAGQVLEDLYAADPGPHLAELAHHFSEGVAQGDSQKAITYARRAADKAVSLLAYEEAVRLNRLALQTLDSSDRVGTKERCDVLLALGDALSRSGDEAGSKDTFLHAAELSKRLGLREHLATAALGYGGRLVWVRAGGDANLVPLLEDSLRAVGDNDSKLKALILARLAGALRDDPSAERRESLGKQAVDLGRRLRDPATLAYALDGLSAALWKPDIPEERLAIANELIEVGRTAGDRERVLSGHQFRIWVFLDVGDLPAAYRELDAISRASDELRQPAQGWIPASIRVVLAIIEGRWADAESWMSVSMRQRGGTNRSDAEMAYALHMFELRREEGRLAEIEDLLARSAREFTWYPHLQCALAVLHCELGRRARARSEFEDIAAGGFARLAFDNKWTFAMSLLAEVARFLEDERRATILYERLLPYADLNAIAAGDGCTGSVARALGVLATTASRFDEAQFHFQEALERNARMGARPSVAYTQHDFAAMLMLRNSVGDTERAVQLLSEALQTCEELGMPALHAKARAALATRGVTYPTGASGTAADRALPPSTKPGAPSAQSAGTDRPAVADGVFRLEGEYWTVGYEGRVLRLRDSKGMRVLAQLFSAPGRPQPSLDLERLGADGDEATARAAASGDAGELLDEEARRAYRRRTRELREAIQEAESWGKSDQAGALREEMDFITRELSRALGFGGRSRRAGSTAERARVNVTRAVKSALRRIAAAEPGLAAHLEATVHTGTMCVYAPDPRTAIVWQVSLAVH